MQNLLEERGLSSLVANLKVKLLLTRKKDKREIKKKKRMIVMFLKQRDVSILPLEEKIDVRQYT